MGRVLRSEFNLSDPAVEEALYDSAVMRSFACIDLGREPVPNEITVCKFRHLLEDRRLGGQVLEIVNLYLQRRGMRISTGTQIQEWLWAQAIPENVRAAQAKVVEMIRNAPVETNANTHQAGSVGA